MQRKPWWLLDRIVGFDEADDDADDTDDTDDTDDADDADDDDDDSSEEDDGKESKSKEKPDPLKGLKTALGSERKQRRQLARENAKLKKDLAAKDSGEKDDKEQLEQRATTAETRSEKLAANLRKSTIDNAIIKHATKLKFRDLDDALALVDRDLIEIDQDDDDPSDIELDEDTVEAAVKSLADKKPHLLTVEGEGGETGGRLGGRRDRKKDGLDEETLKATYPALR